MANTDRVTLDDLRRSLEDARDPVLNYQLRYLDTDPPAGAFGWQLLLVDREFRRAAREVRDNGPRDDLEARRRRRPLPMAQGLVVQEGHRSDFTFLLEVPDAVLDIVLSQPVDFFFRLVELRAAYEYARRFFLRRRNAAGELAELELQLPAPLEQPIKPVLSRAASAASGVYEVSQKLTLPDGTQWEMVERVERPLDFS